MARRPLKITVLGVVFELIFVACGCFGLGVFADLLPEVPSPIRGLALFNAASAAVVAISLHRVRPWSLYAARTWSASAMALFVSLLIGASPLIRLAPAVPIGVVLVGFCWWVDSSATHVRESAA